MKVGDLVRYKLQTITYNGIIVASDRERTDVGVVIQVGKYKKNWDHGPNYPEGDPLLKILWLCTNRYLNGAPISYEPPIHLEVVEK